MRFYRNVFRLSHACHTFLSECLAFGSYLSCVPLGMSCVRLMPVMRFSRNVLRSITPAVCRLCAKQNGLRDVPFLFRRGSRSPVLRSRIVSAIIGLCRFTLSLRVSLWRSRQRTKGTKGRGERGWRRGLCASLRSRIGPVMLSAGNPLGLRAPNLRQRVFDSLDSLHAAAGLGWCVYAPSPGYTERPARAQFGAG